MPSHEYSARPHVLIVENDELDSRLASDALGRSALAPHVHVVRDGEAALRFLRAEGEHSNAPGPALVLLDLNLPRIDGRSVLAAMKNDESLRAVPVIVISTSSSDRDVADVYRLQASSYVCKSLDVEEFEQAVLQVADLWLSPARAVEGAPPATNKLPEAPAS